MFFLDRGAGIPHDALAGRDGEVEETVLVGAPEAELGEFVAEVGSLLEELQGVGFVS